MALDAVTLIENLASGVFSSGLNLLFTWAEMIGSFGLISLLAKQRFSRTPLSPGLFSLGLFSCAAMVSLPSIINASGAQLGFGATSFDAIAYVQPSTFGVAAGAANAVLSIARLAGVGFALSSLDMFRRSALEGHTALSSSESIRAATVKLISGTGLVFSPQLIDAALNTLGLLS
ncbi:conjugal transfer protein TraQ [Lelliottia amnigena]|uniref:conjugal transfer protein TraQ n=1 Tax=Lelliottia amnigena TaxID=61646 RepID=UPI001C220386|nr:conjugal transfer protein TraQ [Lelliottia amnigena]QXB24135.1 conjugal transfer protein TraQ [Lelliottia amnigena]